MAVLAKWQEQTKQQMQEMKHELTVRVACRSAEETKQEIQDAKQETADFNNGRGNICSVRVAGPPVAVNH
jgi:hypothetical protein